MEVAGQGSAAVMMWFRRDFGFHASSRLAFAFDAPRMSVILQLA